MPFHTAVRDLVTAIIDIARRYAPADAVAVVDSAAGEVAVGEAADGGAPASAGSAGPTASPGQIVSRDDALRVLGEIANFFRRTEPHSPISYTLDEAVRRGRLTFPSCRPRSSPT